ncbi:hypothetical protein AV654_19405 [Paenibacillus elgii]|uniref:Uncharacterized protein n=1 Tax=Paenibacillus elgii TaxID=189691 RepID=A0A161S1N7_9BACL|nr:hypothetical protein [Paenibacillus elgii]KZE78144.1 hypothetical protein AV654_19405 [Paenibacillus elgii]
MGYNIECFKSFNIKEDSGDYHFEKVEYEDGNYIYPSALSEIYELFLNHEIEVDLVPTFGEQYYFEGLTKEQTEYIVSRLKDPSECIRIVREHNLLQLVKNELPDCLFSFENLIKKWESGFYVIETY